MSRRAKLVSGWRMQLPRRLARALAGPLGRWALQLLLLSALTCGVARGDGRPPASRLTDELRVAIMAKQRSARVQILYEARASDGPPMQIEVYQDGVIRGGLCVVGGRSFLCVGNGVESVQQLHVDGRTVGSSGRWAGCRTLEDCEEPIRAGLKFLGALRRNLTFEDRSWRDALALELLQSDKPQGEFPRLTVRASSAEVVPDYLDGRFTGELWVQSESEDAVILEAGSALHVVIDRASGWPRSLRHQVEGRRLDVVQAASQALHAPEWWAERARTLCAQSVPEVGLDVRRDARLLALAMVLLAESRKVETLSWPDLRLLAQLVIAGTYSSSPMSDVWRDACSEVRSKFETARGAVRAAQPDTAKAKKELRKVTNQLEDGFRIAVQATIEVELREAERLALSGLDMQVGKLRDGIAALRVYLLEAAKVLAADLADECNLEED